MEEDIEFLKKELTELRKQRDQNDVFDVVKKRAEKWLIGLGVYAGILLTVVGITSFTQAKNLLVENFNKRSIPVFETYFSENVLPEIKRKMEENIELRTENLFNDFEIQLNVNLERFAEENNLKKPQSAIVPIPVNQGYVHSNFIEEKPDGKFVVNVVNVGLLNVRAFPSIEAPVIGILAQGTNVRIVESEENWLKIEVEN